MSQFFKHATLLLFSITLVFSPRTFGALESHDDTQRAKLIAARVTFPAFIGRNIKTYLDMFDLDEDELHVKKFADIPGGASSLFPELCLRGKTHPLSRAIDIQYGKDIASLKPLIEKSMLLSFGPEREESKRFYQQYGENHQLFLKDYEACPERYVAGDISELCSSSELTNHKNSFELILSANLLFLYHHLFDYDFHMRSISSMLELLQGGGKLMIFPVDDFMGKDAPFLDKVIDALERMGHKVSFKKSRELSVGQKMNRIAPPANDRGKILVIEKSDTKFSKESLDS